MEGTIFYWSSPWASAGMDLVTSLWLLCASVYSSINVSSTLTFHSAFILGISELSTQLSSLSQIITKAATFHFSLLREVILTPLLIKVHVGRNPVAFWDTMRCKSSIWGQNLPTWVTSAKNSEQKSLNGSRIPLLGTTEGRNRSSTWKMLLSSREASCPVNIC